MKTNKRLFIMVMAASLVLLLALNAGAAWYTCSITMVGVNYSSPAIRLTDTAGTPAFTNTWFRLAGPSTKQMLATALTALSMGKNVIVNAQGIAAFDDITGIYVAP